MEGLNHTEIDGVPTVWTAVPGPLRATLTFRVGSADETYVTSGVTHLLEHLALFGIGRPGDHSNGFVDQTRTAFQVVGDGDEVSDFLAAVTRQLTTPPLHRLAAERGLLQAERARRRGGVAEELMVWRYGAAGYGLVGYDERGAQHLRPDYLAAWSAHFITRDNCVLWLSGPPPAGLRLSLPPGRHRPAPDPHSTSILPRTPAWLSGSNGSAALSAIMPRSYAAPVLVEILGGRLVDELRTEHALAYSPSASYSRLTADTARVLAVTDLVAGREAEAVPLFLRALWQLGQDPQSEHGVRKEELARVVAGRRRHASDPEMALGLLDAAAWEVLHGLPALDLEQSLTAIESVQAEDVAALAQAAFGSVLAVVPLGLGPRGEPWSVAPASSHPPLYGRSFPSLHQDERKSASMVLALTGLTARDGDDHLTVPLNDTAGLLCWDDGKRVLVGRDGIHLLVEPTLWREGAELVQALDATWPAELRIGMGPRPGEDIPQPAAKPKTHRIQSLWQTISLNALRRYGVPLVVLSLCLLEIKVRGDSGEDHLIPATAFSAAWITRMHRIWDRR
jgi:zinc protease